MPDDDGDEPESEHEHGTNTKGKGAAGTPAHPSKRVKGVDTTVKVLQVQDRGNDKDSRIRNGRRTVKCIVYDMAEFLQSCVERYLELA
jgi:hypothetical protein